jgi:hypothetical protein
MGFKLPFQLIRPPPPAPKPVALKAVTSAPVSTVTAKKGYSDQSTFVGSAAPAVAVATPSSPFSETVSKVLQGVSGLISGGKDRLREAIAVAKLPPDQRVAYQATQAALRANGDTAGQDALRDLLLNHPDVLSATDPTSGRTTLDFLSDLGQPGAASKVPGASAADVLGQTVQDLDAPEGMVQGDDNWCGTLSAQQQMAKDDPAGYACVLSGLTLNGTVTVPKTGVTLNVGQFSSVDPDRSSTQQIVGQAILGREVNPDNPNYVTNNEGVSTPQSGYNHFLEINDAPPATTKHGTRVGDQALAQQALLGGDYQGEVIPAGDAQASAAAKATLVEQAANGKQVSVLMAPGEGSDVGHWVTVTGVDPQANTVTYLENGVSKTEDLDAFLNGTAPGADGQPAHPAIEALTFDRSVATPGQPPEAYIDWRSDDGGGGRLGGASVPSSNGQRPG